MDPLSDVLSLLKIRSYACRGFQAGSEWSVHFGPSPGIKLFAVIAGQGWLAVDEVPNPVLVRAGDCLLLPSGRPYQAASDLNLPPLNGTQLLNTLSSSEMVQFSEGSEFHGIAGYFDLAGENSDLLLPMLPPIVHIREESDKQVLRWCLERMRKEFQEPQPGTSLVAQQLATLMLVQILRTYLTSGIAGHVGWLFALADKKISLSLQAMHEKPGYRWTLTTLAQHAGMSRTGFAVRFRELAGIAPINYLTRWRMSLAKDRILHSNDAIGVVAQAIGYDSESAFSTAFKRLVGCAPRRYSASLKVKAETGT
jgi:AraC-like DNA-binding protein